MLRHMDGYILTIWNRLESVLGYLKNSAECSAEHSVFSRLCHIGLNMFPHILQLMEGYILTIWNSLESVFRLLKKFRGRFRVFQIVSFKVKRRSDVPQIDTE